MTRWIWLGLWAAALAAATVVLIRVYERQKATRRRLEEELAACYVKDIFRQEK